MTTNSVIRFVAGVFTLIGTLSVLLGLLSFVVSVLYPGFNRTSGINENMLILGVVTYFGGEYLRAISNGLKQARYKAYQVAFIPLVIIAGFFLWWQGLSTVAISITAVCALLGILLISNGKKFTDRNSRIEFQWLGLLKSAKNAFKQTAV